MRGAIAHLAGTLLSLVVFSSAWAQTPPTGRLPEGISPPQAAPYIGPRVVGGAPSDDRKIVGIAFTQDGEERVCSGLYISAHRILTAAHCTCNASNFRVSNNAFIAFPFQRAEFVSRFGDYQCDDRYLPRGDDLALLAIYTSLPATEKKFTCHKYSLLPAIRTEPYLFPTPPKYVSVAGYGYSGPTANEIGHRQEAIVSLDSINCGPRAMRQLGCKPFAEFIAGGTPVGGAPRDTCGGDSGGPAFFRVKGEIVPFGIVSRALPLRHFFQARACGSGGIYTHLGRRDVLAWLRAHGVGDGGGDPLCRGSVATR